MLRNYLTVAVRLIRRHVGYSAINIVGLGVGLAATLLILLFVADELSYDRFQRDGVARLTVQEFDDAGAERMHRVLVDPAWTPLLAEQVPEIEAIARLTPVGPILSVGNRRLDCGRCYWTDPNLLDVLTLSFVDGDPATALSGPNRILLSRSRAEALFGRADVAGSTLTVNSSEFTVAGVFEDLPRTTHLPVDGIGTLSSFGWFDGSGWDSPNYATYVRLAPGTDLAALEAKLADVVARSRSEDVHVALHLQPVRDIHLESHLVGELGVNGSMSTVVLLSAVALFILAIACINFMNLSTARASMRAREVGVRKATGAQRAQLVAQFLGESLLLVLVALLLAVVAVQLALPWFNSFTGKDVGLLTSGAGLGVLVLLGVGLVTGVAAGSYPAFFLSAVRPASALRGERSRRSAGGRLRSALVVVQFVVAMVLAVGAVVVFRQLSYVQSRPLGYDRENILVMPVMWDLKEQFDPVRERLLSDPDIVGVAQSNPVPGSRLHTAIEAAREDPAGGRLEHESLYAVWADQGFFDTYGIDVVAGRTFTDEFASDEDTGFILNESAVARLGYARAREAVGEPLRVGGWRGQVIGVVADVHFESLHQPIVPQVFYMDPRNYRAVAVRYRPGADVAAVASRLESEWARYDPESIFSYEVLDSRLRQLYDGERRLGRLIALFAGLAVFVTCLGIFGLASFAAERRVREIGVRKVFGASSPSIVALLNRDVLLLAASSLVVALPVGLYAASRWLESFAYTAGIPWVRIAGVIVAFVAIAIGTVTVKAVRAAGANPVESLRSE